MATEGGLGPSKDTAVGEVVMITLTGSDAHGLKMGPDRDGNSAVIKGMERLPNGKFGSIQRHGGIHIGDVLLAINDSLLEHMPHRDAMIMLNDRNLLRKQLRFISSPEYYARKKKHAPSAGKVEARQSFVSKLKRARVTDSAQGKFAEYEVACQWRIVGNDRIAKDRLFQWSVWKRFTEFDTLHKKVVKSLGWQMDGVQFPPSYTMTMNKYSLEFIERRREELNTYWQAVVAIGKVAEFDKHHCSMELKQFLDVENAMVLNEQSGANTNALERSEEEVGASRPAARRLSVKPASSRRLSTKQDSMTNFTEDTSAAVTTTTSRPRPQSQRPASNQGSPQPGKSPARPASSSSPPPAASPPPAPAPTGPPMSKLMQENLGKYNKMKSMLPEGAVRQRMSADGCSDAEIDIFFGADVAAPAPSTSSPAPVAAAPTKKAATAPPPAPSGGGKAPASAPAKTAGRTNLLADIAKRRIE